MKRFGLLITLALAITIGGVYATWVYSQTNDVADITGAKAIQLTGATFEGSYGTYNIDVSGVSLTVDPKPGTAHTTSLLVDGDVKITFTPSTYSPVEVKNNGVETKYYFTLSNSNWTYDDGAGEKSIIAINHPDEKHDITTLDVSQLKQSTEDYDRSAPTVCIVQKSLSWNTIHPMLESYYKIYLSCHNQYCDYLL